NTGIDSTLLFHFWVDVVVWFVAPVHGIALGPAVPVNGQSPVLNPCGADVRNSAATLPGAVFRKSPMSLAPIFRYGIAPRSSVKPESVPANPNVLVYIFVTAGHA